MRGKVSFGGENMTFMKRIGAIAVAAAVGASFLTAPASAGVVVDVFASSAPNAYGSPSWAGYLSNAMTGLRTGVSNVGGSRDTAPTAYEQLNGSFVAGDAMVTSFHSWRGSASPAAPFDAEYGNRLHFGLLALGTDGTQFSLSDVSFSISSSDSYNGLGWSGTLAGTTLNGTNRIGVLYGANGVYDYGLGDDILLTGNQADDVLVDALIYGGAGNAFWPQPTGGETEQQAIDGVAAYYNHYVATVTGSYSIATADGVFAGDETLVNAGFVPEPWTLSVFGLGVAGLFGLRRRRAVRA